MANKIKADYHYALLILGEPYNLDFLESIVQLIDLTVEALQAGGLYRSIPADEMSEIEDIRKELLKILEPEPLVI